LLRGAAERASAPINRNRHAGYRGLRRLVGFFLRVLKAIAPLLPAASSLSPGRKVRAVQVEPVAASHSGAAYTLGQGATRTLQMAFLARQRQPTGLSPSLQYSLQLMRFPQMESSFTPIEQMLNFRANRQKDFPLQEIMLTRLCMHMQSKLLENRNKMLKAQGINETLFMALITLDAQENHSIQPSELSSALGSSRTNATRIADELEKRGWIERRESDNDRRCLHLHLTEKGNEFLRQLLPPQHQCLQLLWSALSQTEKGQLEEITRKLLNRLDKMDEEETVAALSGQAVTQ